METKYANGIYFNKPHEKAPDFVLGSISVHKDKFMEWLKEQQTNEKGYIRLKVNNGREDKPYVAVDDWKPEKKTELEEEINPDDIPFN